ncbi:MULTISPECIES: IucA/IucC family protein [unclassified Brenneria]|uniref:IucA/IucC family protein n=1 Tax=unclassified Brenneria TaxID=2634434 RepID=UPI0018F0A99B|nr:IucA/IucC family protein [Brenneria sp. L3-3C-1]MBJ7223945.1 siderophore biosynthesis protein [Brenneria sp. L3-3C-1]MEE3645189.1 IucA/IucC family protein [Brenneria sp. L3_3C_1]
MKTSLAVHEKPGTDAFIAAPLRDAAEYATFTALLNCYIREFAQPAGQVRTASGGNIPQALASKMLAGDVVVIDLCASQRQLAIKADRWSLLGRGRYNSTPFIKQFGKPWRAICAGEAIRLLQEEMAAQLQQGINPELVEQIENSIRVTHAFLETPLPAYPDNFVRSEQSLIWGHPMHPTPKSRSGVDPEALLACSPEAGAHFPLYWFRIDPRLLQQQGDARAVAILSTLTDEAHAYPCHPWEADHILRSPLYQQARRQGLIAPLGLRGAPFYPTSSVRTLYQAGLPWFLKCSIHVRLTNCVRKNAWYELESAVALNTLLAETFCRLENQTPGFHIMREPAASSLDFSLIPGADAQEARHLQECFGILYRENLPPATRLDCQVEMAAALFAWDRQGNSLIAPFIARLAAQRDLSWADASQRWLTAYLDVLLPGVLNAFFNEGVIFEPHLQNTLIGLQNGLPHRVWIRDLEGTKLDPSRWPAAALSGMSERARQSVWYPRDKGWQRIAYCLLINNLSEALFHLAGGDRTLEQQLWNTLAQRLTGWRREPEIAALLSGAKIPSKNNLRTRLLQRADKQADYTPIAHPMRAPV